MKSRGMAVLFPENEAWRRKSSRRGSKQGSNYSDEVKKQILDEHLDPSAPSRLPRPQSLVSPTSIRRYQKQTKQSDNRSYRAGVSFGNPEFLNVSRWEALIVPQLGDLSTWNGEISMQARRGDQLYQA